jgi:hypothetical protein
MSNDYKNKYIYIYNIYILYSHSFIMVSIFFFFKIELYRNGGDRWSMVGGLFS